MGLPTAQGLRRGVLAVSVLHDVDLRPLDGGVSVPGVIGLEVSWAECVEALQGADPDSDVGRVRLANRLLTRRWLADHPLADLAERVRPVGLPVGHVLHPGPGWVQHRVLGGALELGLGLLGLDPSRPDAVVVVAPGAWAGAGINPSPWWAVARGYLADMCRIAVQRRLGATSAPLRPMGDCDVVTLLGCGAFRLALAGAADGMVAAGVPMRDRGWTDLRRIDPAFVVAAAAATEPEQRGFARPVLITVDEVTMVAAGGRPAQQVLGDAPPDRPELPPVRYR